VRKAPGAGKARCVFMHSVVLVFSAAVSIAWCGLARAQGDALVVRTGAGLVRGTAWQGSGAQFLGIPYAEPPLGPLRWRAPVPKKPWAGIRDAAEFGGACPQPDMGWNHREVETSREDCLYLNVIAPVWPAKTALPVMFWLHGGANKGGSGSGDLYNAGKLPDHGVVLVTINYRLGILGFFAHPALAEESPHGASGNYALMDQILALHWVQDNIAKFGGDPNNVTVFGQSAGSMDAGMLMTSPRARGLFQKAILESGVPLAPPPTPLGAAEKSGEDFAALFAAPAGQSRIASLRQVPALDLIAKSANSEWGRAPVGPDIDGYVLSESPAEVFKAGREAPIAVILGTTTREFTSSEPADQLRETIQRVTGKYAGQALALYGLAGTGEGKSDLFYGTAADQWNADTGFRCPVTTVSQWHTAAHHPVYEYEFDHAIPGHEAQGATHSGELPYVFGFFPTSGNISGNFSEVDKRLAETIGTYWTNFAKTGNPNSAGLANWPEFDSNERYLIFAEDGNAVLSRGPLRGAQCDLYRETIAGRLNEGQ